MSRKSELMMKASFEVVLAREAAALAGVSDAEGLNRWRIGVLRMVTDADSPYARVLQPMGDLQDRARFVESWSDLIAAALARVAGGASNSKSINVSQMGVSVVAALYGGAVLSRVAREPSPLRISVGLALAPLLPADEDPSRSSRAGLSVQ